MHGQWLKTMGETPLGVHLHFLSTSPGKLFQYFATGAIMNRRLRPCHCVPVSSIVHVDDQDMGQHCPGDTEDVHE